MTTFADFFMPINVAKAENQLQNAEEFILFIGRPTCPYCRRFEPKLTQVAKENKLDIYYINSDELSPELDNLRSTYNVATVPGLLVAKGGQVKVVCDSSLSEEEILDFIKK
ncbi:thioredoxin domain-containing protein [Streptococcus equinus]|uniref:thioredoxin domain-containing protein n=1 Tax=Streptococcus equinus TaxID=1335 RepID=UPI00088D83F5|nr:thioredoxin domain-containing protein [Streptococcus equinus]SDQ15929.1 bacteriocin transport accessory protein, putative [Streptococcus equinus]SEN58820.1 bacteriocin transport accessory protein, putative [Streptococcus equinus]